MRLRRRHFRLLLGLSLPLVLAGLAGSQAPLLDLANLVALPAALLAALAAAGLAWIARRLWKRALLAALALGCAAAALPPPAPAPAACAPGGASLKLAWLNALQPQDAGTITAWLDAEQPDIVAFAELGPRPRPVVEAVRARYPHLATCTRSGRCSTLIASRIAPLELTPLARGDANARQALSAVKARFALADGTPLELLAAHLSRPVPLGRQGEELAELAGQLESSADAIVVGDFNATARMQVLRGFAHGTGLAIHPADGPTWPTRPLGLIQIDHVLTGQHWAVQTLRRAPGLGSDHAGLVAQLCRAG